jgi:choline dehydrogenase
VLDGIERRLGAATGTMPVEPQRDPSPHTTAFLDAVREAGFTVEDANLETPDGFTRTLVTQHGGARASTATTYLRQARGRPNLDVRTFAHATRIRVEGRRAVGVDYVQGGRLRTVAARAEVVLSGGTVGTPQLLQLSGVGPAETLRRFGIDVVADAPEVGANLTDHLAAGLVVEATGGTLYDATRPGQLLRYLGSRRGMLTSNVGEAYGFVRSRPELALPDLELIFAPVAYVGEGLLPVPGHGLTVGPILLTPRSRGTVTLASPDPFDRPVVDPRYLTDEAGEDRAALLAGLRIAERILAAPALRARSTGRMLVPEGGEALPEHERHELALERYAHTLYHPTGTARMGHDPGSVVDPELRVRGVEGLRVADASVFPAIIRGHTNAPAIAVGERAAALIAGRRG